MTPPQVRAALMSGLALLSACDQPPTHVYVLEAPQVMALAASASAQAARVGQPVVLSASRKTQGAWKRMASTDLIPEQCWMAALPPSKEDEVADNVHWHVAPHGAAVFNTDARPDRTREVRFSAPGTYTLVPSTGAWCEPGRRVEAAAVRVTVLGP